MVFFCLKLPTMPNTIELIFASTSPHQFIDSDQTVLGTTEIGILTSHFSPWLYGKSGQTQGIQYFYR